MANMINVSRKDYDEQGNLVQVYFCLNADNIDFVQSSTLVDSWERSVITMSNGNVIGVCETKEEIVELIKG
jgi:uncharacterized protein YlzI (FlbEa/FlbD family)